MYYPWFEQLRNSTACARDLVWQSSEEIAAFETAAFETAAFETTLYITLC